jgi:3-phosphoshikimate 1-carboxyvinyltransferase
MVNAPRDAFVSSPGAGVAGEIGIPGDKSISHRAALLGAIAKGTTEIEGFLESADCRATLTALEALGVAVERSGAGRLRIQGVGLHGLRAPGAPLDLGNSGTAMRLLAGILAGQGVSAVLVGDASLMQRPMARVATPLARMGAGIRTRDGRPPVEIAAGTRLRGVDHTLEVASAQVKSALLLAGLHAEGTTRVREPGRSRDHTERMFPAFGVHITLQDGAVAVTGPAEPAATRVDVPGDFSSAAFFIVAGLIAGRGPLMMRGVGTNPTRTALIDILRAMGGDIRLHPLPDAGPEPRADIEVRPSRLRGTVVPEALVPAAIDELPVLFAAAAAAEGETVVTGAGELRVKESDRLAAMAEGLATLGISCERLPEGLRVRGGAIAGGTIDSRDDHRIAMAFAILGARARTPVTIRHVQNVATSFPGFAETARAAGIDLREGE